MPQTGSRPWAFQLSGSSSETLQNSPGLSGALQSSPELSVALWGSVTERSSDHKQAITLAIPSL
eukprot:7187593-Alexandrium_andersonii.AAC.1